jgi:hypothetical protein
MKVDLIVVGKTDQAEVRSLVAAYLKRLNFYAKVTLTELPDLKNTRSLSAESQKRQEGEALLRQFGEGDYVVLLDEKGAQLRIAQALFRDRRSLRFLAESVRAGRRSVVAFGHDLFPSDRARPFRRAALPGLYDYPQRALSSRIVRCRFAEPALCPTGARDLFPAGRKGVPHYDYCRAADVRSSR